MDESLETAEELGDTYCICISWSLLRLAMLVRSEDDAAAAAELFRGALGVADRHGDRIAFAECLEGLAATLAVSRAELQEAAALLGTAHALREPAGAPVPAADLPRLSGT